ncbi:MAG: glycosyltransferase family 4 protein [Actinomycetota bacterium]|nr:glycosyltransferase family 4 protein [Actinomycetota bacterium]
MRQTAEHASDLYGRFTPLVRILLWHGYLLTGSGSNLYTANLARVWRRQGHDVLLMCQESAVDEVDFIDEFGDFSEDNSTYGLTPTGAPRGEGRCRLARPNIGSVLPVYVFDEYEGFTAKTYVDLTEEELAFYTEANIRAMVTAIRRHEPDAIVTGHEVMGPYIALQACRSTGTKYLAKLHGSALEYAVKKQDRYLPYARDGLCGAKVVTGGSNYMLQAALEVVPGWADRAAVVNPGCDADLFWPREKNNEVPVVGYVGKFIAAKGVHNFLAALGEAATDPLRAVLVGYGGFEAELKQLRADLVAGDVDAVRRVAQGEGGVVLPHLLEWVGRADVTPDRLARAAQVDVQWPGRLDHGPLSQVLPTFDALVVPSVVPEAFGMVAAEAAASGVLPIVPRHSGIGEVGAALEAELARPGLLTFDPNDPISGIATTIDRVLALPRAERAELELAASAFARSTWSWERVAGRMLDLAAN